MSAKREDVVPIKSDQDTLVEGAQFMGQYAPVIVPMYLYWDEKEQRKKVIAPKYKDDPGTQDPEEIERLLRDPHPDLKGHAANGYGYRTRGLYVDDYDGEDGKKSFKQNRSKYNDDLIIESQSGGFHVVCIDTTGRKLTKDTSKSVIPGLDIVCGNAIMFGPGSSVARGGGKYSFVKKNEPKDVAAWQIEIYDKSQAFLGSNKGKNAGRNDTLSRKGFVLRKNGASVEQIEEALLRWNLELFHDNPLPESEVRSIARKKAGISADLPLNDLGNGQRLAQFVAEDFRHIADLNQDMSWSDSGWLKDRANSLHESFKNVIDEMLVQAIQLDGKPGSNLFVHAKNAGNLTKIKAACALARLEAPIRTLADEWDRDGDLITFSCGTVLNIRTGETRPMVRDDLIRHRINAPYEPDTTCPEFDYLIDHLVDGDAEARAWLLQLWSTGLVTTVAQKIIFVLHGARDSGKTTVVELVKKVLGEFAISYGPEFIIRPKFPNSKGPDPEILNLLGKRAMFIPEFPRGRLDDGKLKNLTGDDTKSVRGCHSNDLVAVRCRMTVTISSNSKPFFDATDDGMLTRIRALHIRNSIAFKKKPKKTNAIDSIFKREASGIAALFVRSLRDLIRANGELPKSSRIEKDTGRLNTANDRVAMFLEQRCVTEPDRQESKADLYRAYLEFCKDDGHQPFLARSFHEVMKETHGFKVKKVKGARMYVGVDTAL